MKNNLGKKRKIKNYDKIEIGNPGPWILVEKSTIQDNPIISNGSKNRKGNDNEKKNSFSLHIFSHYFRNGHYGGYSMCRITYGSATANIEQV